MVLYGLGGKNALGASQAVREMRVMVNGVVFLCGKLFVLLIKRD